LASIIASIGILFSAVASCLPGIQIIAAIFGITPWPAAIILITLVAAYVFFGGMKGAGVSGMMKLIIIWVTLFIAGATAYLSLKDLPNFAMVFPPSPWFSLMGNNAGMTMGNLFSLIVGIVCTQTYIQAIFSASDSRTAVVGAFAAAMVVIPVGLPSVAIGMFMHANHPDILPILVLPMYLLKYQPAWLGGIGIAGIMLSLIGSIAGLALGIGTMISKDICCDLLNITKNKKILWINRSTVVIVTLIACIISILNLKSSVLDWNYMSMALRGGGVFLPLTLAIFAPGVLTPGWAVLSMILSTIAAIIANTILHLTINPLFVGIAVSAVFVIIGLLLRRKDRMPTA
jgi:SSS family solute:Na+ symporter